MFDVLWHRRKIEIKKMKTNPVEFSMVMYLCQWILCFCSSKEKKNHRTIIPLGKTIQIELNKNSGQRRKKVAFGCYLLFLLMRWMEEEWEQKKNGGKLKRKHAVDGSWKHTSWMTGERETVIFNFAILGLFIYLFLIGPEIF